MCKIKFKTSPMKGIPISDVYDTLGQTKDIRSILLPSRDEEAFMSEILDEEGGWDDADDAVVDQWMKCLIMGKKPLWIEALYKQDIDSRALLLEDVPSTSVDGELPPSTPAVPRSVAVATDDSAGWVEAVSALKKAMEDGFKKIHEKFDVMAARLKSVEAYVTIQRENETWYDKQQQQQWEQEQQQQQQQWEHEQQQQHEVVEEVHEDEMGEAEEEEGNKEEEEDNPLAMVVYVPPLTTTDLVYKAVEGVTLNVDRRMRKTYRRTKRKEAGEKVRSPVETRQRKKKKKASEKA